MGTLATHVEVISFVELRKLMGRGLGYVDVHLVAAASIERMSLWKLDKRLAFESERLGIGA